MIAHRYVPLLCVVLGAALVPTLIHSYSGTLPQDGRSAAALSARLGEYGSSPTTRSARWGSRRFGSDDWTERMYTSGDRRIQLTVVRSYDAKTLYHHPELAIADSARFAGVRAVRLAGRPDVPIHVLTPAPGVNASAAYVLHYGGRFVEDPIWFQLRTAGELLITRRQPMTLFFALESAPGRGEAAVGPPTELLLAAVDDFLAQNATPARAAE